MSVSLLTRALAAGLLLITALPLQAAEGPSKNPAEMLAAPRKPGVTHGAFDLISIGDLLYSHPMVNHPAPAFQAVLKIVRSGDVAIGNQEGVFMDLKAFKGEAYGPGQLWGEPTLARDMRAMGIDMVSVANNHSLDWGPEGLLETRQLLDAAGMVHSGGGANLEEARRAGILATPKARVALVSAASTFKPNATANDRMMDVPSRPGISTLRTRKIILVTPPQMALVRKLATGLASPLAPVPPPTSTEVTLGEQIYRLSDTPGVHYDMDLYDHAGLLKAVREGKAAADLLVFTIHAHESPTGFDDDTPTPPDFLIKLFHDVVDAGADVVMGGGPHSLRGIEIYKGQPIFYGMDVFFIKGEIKELQETAFQVFPDATGKAPPPEPPQISVRRGGNPASWYDGMVASTEFKDGKPVLVRIYPLDVGNTYDRTRRGNPHLADPLNAVRILTMLQTASAALGTRIVIDGATGVIDLSGNTKK